MEKRTCIGCGKDLPVDCFSGERTRCNICRMEKQQGENDATRPAADNHARPWSKADDDYLLEHRNERAADLARHLGRTLRAVRRRRREVIDQRWEEALPILEASAITDFRHHASPGITQITVNFNPPKLVVFTPTNVVMTSVEEAFAEQGMTGELFIAWMLNKRGC